MKVTFNYHSCFTVELDSHILIFDYFDPTGMERAVDRRQEIELDPEKSIYVFSSHRHPDHYSERIFDWVQKYPDINYVISDDIKLTEKSDPRITSVSPDKSYIIGDVRIDTIGSTDEGVAFIVTLEGRSIYHAGDLHWWYWEERGQEYIDYWGSLYNYEVDKLAGRHLDLSFVVLDPRMGGGYANGMIEFLNRVKDAPVVFPMHLWKQYTLVEKFKRDHAPVLADRVMTISYEGQSWDI